MVYYNEDWPPLPGAAFDGVLTPPVDYLRNWTRHPASETGEPYDYYDHTQGGIYYVLWASGKGWTATGLTKGGYSFWLTASADPVPLNDPRGAYFHDAAKARKAVNKYVKEGAWLPPEAGTPSEIVIEDGPSEQEFLAEIPSSTSVRTPPSAQTPAQATVNPHDVVMPTGKPSGQPSGRPSGQQAPERRRIVKRFRPGQRSIVKMKKTSGTMLAVGAVALLGLGILMRKK